jgi:hypothetical protein
MSRELFEPEGWQVLDGGPVKNTEPNVIAVGFTGAPGEIAVEDTRTREQYTTQPDREQYEITCLVSAWHGHETDPKSPRDAVYSVVDRLADALALDQTLDGLVARIRLRTDAYAPEQTSMGAVATVRFILIVDAYGRAA